MRHFLSIYPLLVAVCANAFNFHAVTSPKIDLSSLGRVALAGNTDSLSVYEYEEQRPLVNSDTSNTSSTQALMTTMQNGIMATLAMADADILALCPLKAKNGSVEAVVVGGNFTRLGGVDSEGVALYQLADQKVKAMPGLKGEVTALLYDEDSQQVYIGGAFKAANSTNAVVWSKKKEFQRLPFGGFDGPINSIAMSNNNTILFGGSFTSVGNYSTPDHKDEQQVINLRSASIDSSPSTGVADGFKEPSTIACKTNGTDGADNTWLLPDNTPGQWSAAMGYPYKPTKLRLWNTQQSGKGTKTFRFTALPINGIMNLTYIDPHSHKNVSCDARCPLPHHSDQNYTDFQFVNVIGMNAFQIDISEWYGSGAGLDGIELFTDEISSYAISSFNEINCGNVQHPSTSGAVGNWQQITNQQSSQSAYLSISQDTGSSSSSYVTFTPGIKQPGNYSVSVHTPGCMGTNSCNKRGRVNISTHFSANESPSDTVVWQSNDYEKYEYVYIGQVDASSDSFQPSVTLTPIDGDATEFVASYVQFLLNSASGGSNGVFEYDSSQKNGTDSQDSSSTLDTASLGLHNSTIINSLVTINGTVYAGGNFSSDTQSPGNMIAIDGQNKGSSLDTGGNANITSMLPVGNDTLYVGGSFKQLAQSSSNKAVSYNAAMYSFSSKSWKSLGGGLNAPVQHITRFPLSLGSSKDDTEDVISFSGNFTQIRPYDKYAAVDVDGIAIWVPSKKNWLQNVKDIEHPVFYGNINAATIISDDQAILAGDIIFSPTQYSGGGYLVPGGPRGMMLESYPTAASIRSSDSSSSKKRDISTITSSKGPLTGAFYNTKGYNLTIIAGHFTADATNGDTIHNLLFVNSDKNDEITGITSDVDKDSTFRALAVQKDTLYAGGDVTGDVQTSSVVGLIAYDLKNNAFAEKQPPKLSGSSKDNVTVRAIAPRQDSKDVYVAGNFEQAGNLPCPSVCVLDGSSNTWNRPGADIDGEVFVLQWVNETVVYAGGNFTINENPTRLATFNRDSSVWSSVPGAEDDLTGAVTSLTFATQNRTQYWVAGSKNDDDDNGAAFLRFYDGKQFESYDSLMDASKSIISDLRVVEDADDKDQHYLLIIGSIMIPDFGYVSAATYDGKSLTPFLLGSDGTESGLLSKLLSEEQDIFKDPGKFTTTPFHFLVLCGSGGNDLTMYIQPIICRVVSSC